MIEPAFSPAIKTNATFARAVPRLGAPIVMLHGLCGFNQIRLGPWQIAEYFCGIRDHLASSGNRVLSPQLSLTAGVDVRARQLRRFLNDRLRNEPVHIIAHSMGGLDARHFITKLGESQRVLSLTTIGTPHRGSSFADWCLRRFEALCRPVFEILHVPYQAFLDLSTEQCRRFNDQTPDAATVRYASVAGRCSEPWLTWPWRHAHAVVADAEGENDGVVSLSSARWGEQCEVWDGNHLNLINVKNPAAVRLGLWVDRAILYGKVVQRLAGQGF